MLTVRRYCTLQGNNAHSMVMISKIMRLRRKKWCVKILWLNDERWIPFFTAEAKVTGGESQPISTGGWEVLKRLWRKVRLLWHFLWLNIYGWKLVNSSREAYVIWQKKWNTNISLVRCIGIKNHQLVCKFHRCFLLNIIVESVSKHIGWVQYVLLCMRSKQHQFAHLVMPNYWYEAVHYHRASSSCVGVCFAPCAD